MVVSPRRHELLALAVATLAVAAPSGAEGQRAPQAATVSMQARVGIIPAVDASEGMLGLVAGIAAAGPTAIDATVSPFAAATSPVGGVGFSLGGPADRGVSIHRIARDERVAPPVLRTIEWATGTEDERILRYRIAVIS